MLPNWPNGPPPWGSAGPARTPSPWWDRWRWPIRPEPRPVARACGPTATYPAGDSPRAAEDLADRMERLIESHAPGFTGGVERRWVQTPGDLQAADASLSHGALNGGTAQLQQQLIFRPWPGTGRPETPVERLYLAGSGAHPGGGVRRGRMAGRPGSTAGGSPGRRAGPDPDSRPAASAVAAHSPDAVRPVGPRNDVGSGRREPSSARLGTVTRDVRRPPGSAPTRPPVGGLPRPDRPGARPGTPTGAASPGCAAR